MRHVILISALFCAMSALQADPGDSTIIQTFSFSSGRGTKTGTFLFPDGSKQYEKILMVYTVKCNTSGANGVCGEWDYDQATELLRFVRTDTSINAVIDTSGNVVTDSSGNAIMDTSINTIYDIWRLGVYITPYGNGLTLGDGWSWMYDVSDFVHLLKDSVTLRDHNSQQNLDLKFVFIEGTPVREVISIRKIWDSRGVGFPGYWEGYPLNKFDDIVRDTTIALMPEEKGVKLLSTITGHMMNGNNAAAEFSHNVHTILADGNVIEQFDIIQQCSNNPMYPQGGTWVYARAGWCTGMPGTVREFELTPYVVNNSINFDYDVQSDPNGVYKIDLKMVTYGEVNRPVDVAMVDIIAPTDNLQHKRYNPTLGNPIIKIKNTGADRLTALEISYGFGAQSFTYQWTGSLSFMKETEVTLPFVNWDAVGGSEASGTFFVELRNPNGVADPTPYNNKMTSTFKLPPIYTANDFRMSFKPDKRISETKWRVISIAGNAVMAQSQGGMNYGQTYTADITLPSGGYMLELTDAAGNGMIGWLHNETGLDGAAYLRRKTEYDTWISCYTFKADFGDAERFYFGVNQFTGINEQPSNLANLSIYPNPAQTELNLDLTQLTATYATATVYDITGRAIATQQVISGQINTIDINNLTSGMHFITVSEAGHNIWRGKFMKL